MARWRAETKRDVINFDGCGFGKYCFISFRLALLIPLKPSHNLLVRGSNPCGGTNQLARVVTFTVREFLLGASSNSRWRDLGSTRFAGREVSTVRGSGWV
jgi:hypothetical protein